MSRDLSSTGTTSSDINSDDWFQQTHWSHEPSSPITPPGPLLSSSSPAQSTPPSHYHHHHHQNAEYLSPHVSLRKGATRTGGGLKAKPLRVLVRSSPLTSASDSSATTSNQAFMITPVRSHSSTISRSASKSDHRMSIVKSSAEPRHSLLRRTLLQQSTTPKTTTSPISKFYLKPPDSTDPPSTGSTANSSQLLFSEENWTIDSSRLSSFPSLEGWLATASPSNREGSSPFHQDTNSLVQSSPSPPQPRLPLDEPEYEEAENKKPVLRKLGMASKPGRVQIPQPPPPSNSGNSTARPSPTNKRIKTDAHFFTPAPHEQPSKSVQGAAQPILIQQPKPKNVKIEDLKKLLAEHNQRLRPRRR